MNQKLLATEDLKIGMVILSIIGFSPEFAPLSQEKAAWVRLKFGDATAKVKRGAEELRIKAAEVKTGDHLTLLDNLAALGQHFVVRSSKVSQEMIKKGLILLLVDVRPEVASGLNQISPEDHSGQMVFIQDLIEKISLGVQVIKEASLGIAQTFDALRSEQASGEQVTSQVESILASNSTEVLHLVSLLEQNENVYQHSIGVASLYHSLYFDFVARSQFPSVFQRRSEVFLGAFVHDFGMAMVPLEFYESKERFEKGSQVWDKIRKHPEMGAEILTHMKMPEVIVNMALYHHLKQDSSLVSHYPTHLQIQDSSPETKLLAIVDIYSSLTAARSYSKQWTPPAAIRFLQALVGSEFDAESWGVFYRLMGQYPNGSLVKLSTGESAFVVGQGVDKVGCPIVVPVLDKRGQEIAKNQLLLLEIEKDIGIQEELDSKVIFGDKALEIFSQIRLH